jgi:hypothetical protein
MTSYTNLFTTDELNYLANLPEVLEARDRLTESSRVYFSVSLPESIKSTLHTRLGLDLSSISNVPMRWISGDTHPHIDVGPAQFSNTYLAYLSDCEGEFLLNGISYPISINTAYVFNEGLTHETRNTGTAPRLLLGPMSDTGLPVGSPLVYYPSELDALSNTNILGYGGGFVVGSGGPFGPGPSGYTYWRLASNSTGTSSQLVVYANGDTLNSDGNYYLYPSAPCFLEGSQILCQVDGVESYVPVENLRKGTLVKTSRDGYKKVELIGTGTIYNPGNTDRIEDRLYKCSPSKYPALTEDLIITGCHSILEFPITEKQKEESIRRQGKLYVTDNKYRLMACVDERAEPWANEGNFTIWHFALENDDESTNYGVYANGGLLVETCNIKFLKTKSNMTLRS